MKINPDQVLESYFSDQKICNSPEFCDRITHEIRDQIPSWEFQFPSFRNFVTVVGMFAALFLFNTQFNENDSGLQRGLNKSFEPTETNSFLAQMTFLGADKDR
jgi:hypothetical protein